MESRRQKKVAQLIQETLSEIFQKYGSRFYHQAFVTITEVSITPDLLVAKVYISVYNVEGKQKIIDSITLHVSEIRKYLGMKVRHQLRRVPELNFYLDTTLDEALKIETLLKEIKKPDTDKPGKTNPK